MMAKGTFASINLATRDVDGTFERLQAGDAEVVQEPIDQPYGVRDCAFRDPSGNLIRIQETALDHRPRQRPRRAQVERLAARPGADSAPAIRVAVRAVTTHSSTSSGAAVRARSAAAASSAAAS